MHARFVADKKGVISFTDVLPEFLQPSIIKGTSCKAASGVFGYILLQQIETRRFNIHYNCYCFTDADQLMTSSDSPLLELHFNLGAPLNYHFSEFGNLAFKSNTYNFVYLPVLKNVLFIRPQESYKTFSIQFTRDYLVSIAARSPIMNAWLTKVLAREPALLHSVNRAIPADVIYIIQEILNGTYTGNLLQLYLNDCITDIVFLCLKNNARVSPAAAVNLWESDLNGIEAVRLELYEHLHKKFSLAHLALTAGMNKNKLAKGFRQVVGVPLFNYQLHVRMAKAKSLLLTSEIAVTSIAYDVGYRGVQSFSKAFKKYFGLSPTDYREKYGPLSN